jgi:fatty acid synthase
MRAIIANLVQECKERPPTDEDANSIAGHLLRLRDPAGQPLSMARLMEEFTIFFIAGSETTGHTIAWAL